MIPAMFITILLAGVLLGAAAQIPSAPVRIILLLLTALIGLGASASLDRR
jgi:hypothetical protein